MKRLLSTTEVAHLLQVSRGTIINWINSNKLEHIVLPSGQFRIPRDEVEKILIQVVTYRAFADEAFEDVPLFQEGDRSVFLGIEGDISPDFTCRWILAEDAELLCLHEFQ